MVVSGTSTFWFNMGGYICRWVAGPGDGYPIETMGGGGRNLWHPERCCFLEPKFLAARSGCHSLLPHPPHMAGPTGTCILSSNFSKQPREWFPNVKPGHLVRSCTLSTFAFPGRVSGHPQGVPKKQSDKGGALHRSGVQVWEVSFWQICQSPVCPCIVNMPMGILWESE